MQKEREYMKSQEIILDICCTLSVARRTLEGIRRIQSACKESNTLRILFNCMPLAVLNFELLIDFNLQFRSTDQTT
jgi:hypothetical protein